MTNGEQYLLLRLSGPLDDDEELAFQECGAAVGVSHALIGGAPVVEVLIAAILHPR